MTRNATSKTKGSKPKAKSPTKKAAAAKKATKPKPVTVYTVVRKIPAESPTYSEPDRVFATRATAKRFADERNAELRALTNPFDCNDPDMSMTGGEKAFVALLKQHKLPVPAAPKGYAYIDWENWWDRHYFDMTNAQREALWRALNKFDWYKVKETTLE
jgi:hypothetical protein